MNDFERWRLSVTRDPHPALDLDVLASLRLDDGETLPPSYTSFVETFGWGRLFGLWLVYTPVPRGYGDGLVERGGALTERIRAWFAEARSEDFDWTIEPDGSWAIARRLAVFAASENGDYLMWDTGARSDDGELPVYCSIGGDCLTRAGDDLHAAVEWLRERGPRGDSGGADFEPLDLVPIEEAVH